MTTTHTRPSLADIEAAPWPEHCGPAYKTWRVLLYRPDGPHRDYCFSKVRYSLGAIKARANDEAIYLNATRFSIRDEDGTEVFDGPALDALGNPIQREKRLEYIKGEGR